MKKEPTLEQALETFKITIRDTEPYLWPQWIQTVSISLSEGVWFGGHSYPTYVKQVFDALKKEGFKSKSDSKSSQPKPKSRNHYSRK